MIVNKVTGQQMIATKVQVSDGNTKNLPDKRINGTKKTIDKGTDGSFYSYPKE